MPEWFSIEVFDGDSSAQLWQDSYGDAMVTAAQGERATNWNWQRFAWGVVLELELPDEFAWDRLREHPTVRAALDAVPDPVGGLLLHRGHGGSAGSRRERRPKPFAGSGAVALPLPSNEQSFATSALPDVDRELAVTHDMAGHQFSEVVERLERERGRVVITKQGRPTAVMLSIEDLESLEETLAILSDPKLMREVRRAQRETDASRAKRLTRDEAMTRIKRS